MDFPRLVYKSASVYALAKDKEHYDMLIVDGWFASVPEALGIKPKTPAKPKPKA